MWGTVASMLRHKPIVKELRWTEAASRWKCMHHDAAAEMWSYGPEGAAMSEHEDPATKMAGQRPVARLA